MTTITIPTLSTKRLTLRGFTAADLDALAPIYADPQVSRYIGDGTPADRAATWRALAGMLGHCSSAATACGPSSNEQPAS